MKRGISCIFSPASFLYKRVHMRLVPCVSTYRFFCFRAPSLHSLMYPFAIISFSLWLFHFRVAQYSRNMSLVNASSSYRYKKISSSGPVILYLCKIYFLATLQYFK